MLMKMQFSVREVIVYTGRSVFQQLWDAAETQRRSLAVTADAHHFRAHILSSQATPQHASKN